jgi:hypothetical protein
MVYDVNGPGPVLQLELPEDDEEQAQKEEEETKQ